MKILKLSFYLSLAVILSLMGAVNSFAKSEKKGDVSKKQCEKAIERIFELTMEEYKQKEKEITEDQMKIVRQRWDESKGQLVDQCEAKATKKGVKCVMSAKSIDEATQCPD